MDVNQELYQNILSSLLKEITIDTSEEHEFISRITHSACKGAENYVKELEESVGYLRDTIKRLNKKISETIPVGDSS
jgi:hypothetical protein